MMRTERTSIPVGVDLDDLELTRTQYKRLIRQFAAKGNMRGQRPCEDDDCDDDAVETADSENDDVVNLHEETHGKSRPPKVTRADLPNFVDLDEDEDEEEESKEDRRPAYAKKGKKGSKNG